MLNAAASAASAASAPFAPSAASATTAPPTFNDPRIVYRGNCILVTEGVSLTVLTKLLKALSGDQKMCPHTARVLGVHTAIGQSKDLDALCEAGSNEALARVRAELTGELAAAGLGEDALRWLAIGRQGKSSLALFSLLSGVHPSWGERAGTAPAVPRDPSDFARCRLMLEAIACLGPRMAELAMREQHPGLGRWTSLASLWESLCEEQDVESPHWREGKGHATVLYNRLK